MTDDSKHHIELDGTLVAELLDQSEHPSNIGNVAAISDQQIVLLRRDKRELVNYRFEYFDVRDCHAIKYQKETAYYRIIVGAACFLAAAFFVFIWCERHGRARRATNHWNHRISHDRDSICHQHPSACHSL